MSNHITNKFIEVSNEEKFNKLAVNKEGEVDFSILLLMPEELNITSRGTFDSNLKNIFESSEDFMNAVEADNLEEAIRLGLKIGKQYKNNYGHLSDADEDHVKEFINKRKYGYGTWYEWNINRWGTKWNAYDQAPPYEFNTAWSTPYKWLEELGKNLDFVLIYADEDTGSNYGFVIARNGITKIIDCENLIDDEDKSLVISLYIRGYEEDDIRDYIEECRDEYSKQEVERIIVSKADYVKEFLDIIEEEKENCLELQS